MFDNQYYDNHERVIQVSDDASGLKAIIAIHSTARGPAMGGCRLWSYDSPAAAFDDALRLSQGMSFKNALADLPAGGGKAVILGPLPKDRRTSFFETFGKIIESLNGEYITAEDVGVTEADMVTVSRSTKYVSGIAAQGGVGGNPSPFTARGVRIGLEAAVLSALKRRDLEGLRVAVQGLGGVGSNLCRELSERGAKLIVADLNEKRVEEACDTYSAERASIDDILLADVDILAPCALGGIITNEVAAKMRARIVAGGANNQLSGLDAGLALFQRGITYAPDYVINAGGIIVVTAEYLNQFDVTEVERAISRISERTSQVLKRSALQGQPANVVADQMAKEVISKAARERSEKGASGRIAVHA